MTAQPILFFLTYWTRRITKAGKNYPLIQIPADTWDEFAEAVKDCIPEPAEKQEYPTLREIIEKGRIVGGFTLFGITFRRHVSEADKVVAETILHGMGALFVDREGPKHIPFRKLHTPAPMHKRKAK